MIPNRSETIEKSHTYFNQIFYGWYVQKVLRKPKDPKSPQPREQKKNTENKKWEKSQQTIIFICLEQEKGNSNLRGNERLVILYYLM